MKKETLNGVGLIDLGSIVKPIIIGGLIVGGVYFGNKAYKQYQESKGEQNLDTPEGQIALQLKNIFDATIVSDEDFRKVYLQVNASNSDGVTKEYYRLTHRHLTDDIAEHITTATFTKATKTAAINNKIDGIIKINANEDIEFLVGVGSKVKLSNPNKAITFYAFTEGLIWDLTQKEFRKPLTVAQKFKITVPGGNKFVTVKQTKIVPYDGVKLASDWTKYIRPFVNTHKVFALVKVEIIDKNTKKAYSLWADAREFSKIVSLKGIDAPKCIGELAF